MSGRAQADLDIAQALAVGELGEGQTQELVKTGEGLDVAIAVVALDVTPEGFHGQMVHDLRKDKLAGGHGDFP